MDELLHRAVFLDRDGVINVDHGYVGSVERFEFIDKVPEALSRLKRAGFLTVLVTNQSGIARGMFTEDDFFKVSDFMQGRLAERDAALSAVYFCPHHPQGVVDAYALECDCRKPAPGMFLRAASDLRIDLERSVMVGDHASDLMAARRAGVKKLFLTGSHLLSERNRLEAAKIEFDFLPDLDAVSRLLTHKL